MTQQGEAGASVHLPLIIFVLVKMIKRQIRLDERHGEHRQADHPPDGAGSSVRASYRRSCPSHPSASNRSRTSGLTRTRSRSRTVSRPAS